MGIYAKKTALNLKFSRAEFINRNKNPNSTLGQKPTFCPKITKNLMFENVNFAKKRNFENVNFVKNDTLKL